MREIGDLQAQSTLGQLIDLVQGGEEIVITRGGKPVARLVGEHVGADRGGPAREAASSIRQLRKGVTLGGISLAELVEEGRP